MRPVISWTYETGCISSDVYGSSDQKYNVIETKDFDIALIELKNGRHYLTRSTFYEGKTIKESWDWEQKLFVEWYSY